MGRAGIDKKQISRDFKMKEKKLFIVDTLVTFRNRYVVEAESLEHAYDEVSMLDSGHEDDYFEPFSQLQLTETIIEGRKISYKKFHKLVEALENDENPRESGSPWMGEQLIRVIDYNDGRTPKVDIPMCDEE